MEISDLEKETITEGLEYALPQMVHYLVKRGKYENADLNSGLELAKILVENANELPEIIEASIAVSKVFLKWSKKALDEGENFVAIVLIATALEQDLNTCYRFLFREAGLGDEVITKIIKNHNIDSKLTWLLKVAAQTQLDEELRKKVMLIFDIRNSIVHYKAVPSRLEEDVGSFEKINLELQKLREMNLLELYEQFYSELEKLSSPKDKDWELSLQIAERILTDLFKKKNRAHHQHRK